ncbi:MAG: IPT/TIG domain-containing protein [Pyrinomonadaceae bacterium]
MIEETYPSGRKVQNTLNNDGRLAQVQTKSAYGSYETRADSFVYTSAGEPTAGSLDSYQPITGSELPDSSKEMSVGSGGSYLSNEIFYRTSNVRRTNRPMLPSGHLHVPTIDTTPLIGGPSLIKGAEEILASLLPYAASTSAPQIAGFSPISGAEGTLVTLTGEQFANATSVKIGSVSTQFTVNSNTQLTFIVPSGATTSPINVTTPGGSAVSSTQFTVLQQPVIVSFQPSSGGMDSMVTIYGENLDNVSEVRMGGMPMIIAWASSTRIDAYVSASPGYYFIEIDTPSGTITTENIGYFHVTNGYGGWEY